MRVLRIQLTGKRRYMAAQTQRSSAALFTDSILSGDHMIPPVIFVKGQQLAKGVIHSYSEVVLEISN